MHSLTFPKRAFSKIVEGIFLRLGKIVFENSLHLATEILIVADDIQLFVNFGRTRVEVRRTKHGKETVDHHRFFMDHGWLVFKNLHAAFEEFSVSRTAGRFRQRLIVVWAGQQQSNGDVSPDRFHELLNLVIRWRAVCIRDPKSFGSQP